MNQQCPERVLQVARTVVHEDTHKIRIVAVRDCAFERRQPEWRPSFRLARCLDIRPPVQKQMGNVNQILRDPFIRAPECGGRTVVERRLAGFVTVANDASVLLNPFVNGVQIAEGGRGIDVLIGVLDQRIYQRSTS